MIQRRRKFIISRKRKYPRHYEVSYGRYRRRIGIKWVYHVIRRSYISKIFGIIKRFQTAYYMKNQIKKYRRRKTFRDTKFSQINLIVKRRNTFINLSTKKKVFKALSAGILGYTGRKKSSPIVRERIGKELATIAVSTSRNYVDLYFIKNKGRFYKYVIKGLVLRGLYFRWLCIRHIHPHGYMRNKKKRRT
jgi:hypothetical protein